MDQREHVEAAAEGAAGDSAAAVANMIRQAGNVVFYTGAGVSTGAGIKDYRGPQGMNNTGWLSSIKGLGVGKGTMDVTMPTYCHAAIALLLHQGLAHHVVSSNHDNLHTRSGVPPEQLTEIFGNSYVETCKACKTKYHRHVQVPQLGRVCDQPECNGALVKEGVRMNAMVPRAPLEEAWAKTHSADLAIVLGSSMTVSPFCDMPMEVKQRVLCVLGETPVDDCVDVRVSESCDAFMHRLVRCLGLAVPPFTYRQDFKLHTARRDGQWCLVLGGGHANEPCTCVDSVDATFVSSGERREFEEERCGDWRLDLGARGAVRELELEISFRPEYSAPPMVVTHTLDASVPFEHMYTFTHTVHYS
eukprot:TRINITY_DN14080_c0_g1_i1.p1 TRINITY_DN14080_c0_g1~~TRINITY_DN14080_c0_g1_i1.p1  ORF type:complete len:360 (+),score=92.73 TRINITY_DN14080_c0_g1_i1:78-1157(+)